MSACVDGGAQWEASEGEAEQRRCIVFHRCRCRAVSAGGAVTVVHNATGADIGGGTIGIISVIAIVGVAISIVIVRTIAIAISIIISAIAIDVAIIDIVIDIIIIIIIIGVIGVIIGIVVMVPM